MIDLALLVTCRHVCGIRKSVHMELHEREARQVGKGRKIPYHIYYKNIIYLLRDKTGGIRNAVVTSCMLLRPRNILHVLFQKRRCSLTMIHFQRQSSGHCFGCLPTYSFLTARTERAPSLPPDLRAERCSLIVRYIKQFVCVALCVVICMNCSVNGVRRAPYCDKQNCTEMGNRLTRMKMLYLLATVCNEYM